MADTDLCETAEFALDARYFIGCAGELSPLEEPLGLVSLMC